MTAPRSPDGGGLIGTVVGGRYTLRSILGQGGMATIYRGWDAQLEREVAVKVLRPQYGSDPEFVARFRQEARSAGSLSHPNIVGVHDYGSADDQQFIVMELVDGRDLAAVLREQSPLAVDDAVEVAIEAAAGLEAAHRRGIVHRDVKPANILLTHDGHVRVADFGIARAIAEAGLTTTGTTLGSVHYFSPEQARGEEVTAASDVYALAIVLYEMLTGHRPFPGDSAAAIALSRLSQEPPPPTTYNDTLPAGLVAIVMKALSLDQRARYPSAGVLRAALREWRETASAARPGWATASSLPVMAAGPALAASEAEADANDSPASAAADTSSATVLQPPVADHGAPAMTRAPDGPGDQPGPLGREAPVAVGAGSGTDSRRGDERPLLLWAGLILVALALLSGIGFLGGQLLARSGDPSPSVTASGQVAQNGSVRVPNVVGMTEATAEEALEDAGLVVGRVVSRYADAARGIVVDALPDVDATVRRGEEIVLTVSRGPEPTEPPTPDPTVASTPEPAPIQTVGPPAATPPPPPDPTPEPEPDTAPEMNSAETVAYWYSLVADQRFEEAYALWSDQMKANYERQGNLDNRWDDTAEIVIHAITINREDQAAGVANVYIDFTEIKNTGAEYRFAGTWDLVLGPNGWLLNQPHF